MQEIKSKREQRFYDRRMKVKKQHEKTQNKVEIKNINLIALQLSRNRTQLNETDAVLAAEDAGARSSVAVGSSKGGD